MNKDTSTNNLSDPQKENIYEGLRDLALSMTAEQINIPLPTDRTKAYGVIMDWDLGEGTMTLASFLSGDASIYLSSGGGSIGGGSHENVKRSSIEFINDADKYLDKAVKTAATPLPAEDGIKFYFLTNKGKFVITDHIQNMENNSSEYFDLFEKANKVISEIRITTQRKYPE